MHKLISTSVTILNCFQVHHFITNSLNSNSFLHFTCLRNLANNKLKFADLCFCARNVSLSTALKRHIKSLAQCMQHSSEVYVVSKNETFMKQDRVTYALTLAAPLDFWTLLLYTSGLEDESIVICQRLLTQSTGGPPGQSTCDVIELVLDSDL
ncbi:uncharacterized protein LOC102711208 [Oryza brachyantha]|uniref:uncharacterized protein LOC102711208 n=1 Tax=Oryza brachyantha TaxID=4533 RepID=UPI0003EA94F3|nr:uncharacterized protein LOC102711208 [Oryza brachyantha]XP_015698700.1 uncharacterized protein LOC102711208 [Oryza brachyantha]